MHKALTHAGLLRIYRSGGGVYSTSHNSQDCPVCFEEFPSKERKEFRLSCGHVICDVCARNMCDRQKETCPLCRREDAINCVPLPSPFEEYVIQFKRQETLLFDIKCTIALGDIDDFIENKIDITKVSCSVDTVQSHLDTVKTHFEKFPNHWRVETFEFPNHNINFYDGGRAFFHVTSLNATSTSEDIPGETLIKLLVSVVKHCHDLQPESGNSEHNITKVMTRRRLGDNHPAVPYVFPTEGTGKRRRESEEESEQESPGQRQRQSF